MGYPDLEKLFSDLGKITALKMQGASQLPGNERSVFLLEKNNEYYYLLPSPLFDDVSVGLPQLVDGLFFYAILADHPQQVMVGPSRGNANYNWQQVVRGHASVSLEGDVLYAGDLTFCEFKLVQWTHFSGHYLPDVELRHTQLTPNVKRLLPERLFVDPFQAMHRRRQARFS